MSAFFPQTIVAKVEFELHHGHVATFETEDDAALGALAYDHALLLRALTMGKAYVRRETHEVGTDGKLFLVGFDAAGCPTLTEPLRAARRKAVSL